MTDIHKKNKLKTAGYFIKRLKDNDFVTLRIFDKYSESDPRRWTVFNDGNQNFNNNFSLKTDSIEVVVSKLIKLGVQQKNKSEFLNK